MPNLINKVSTLFVFILLLASTTLGAELAQGKVVSAGPLIHEAAHIPESVVDLDHNTSRWGSGFADNQWLKVDLGSRYKIDTVQIKWEGAYAQEYRIEASTDDVNWSLITTKNGAEGWDMTDLSLGSHYARYIRIFCVSRTLVAGGYWGFSIYTLQVYGRAHRVTVANGVNGSVTPSNDHFLIEGDSLDIQAVPDAWYHFDGWGATGLGGFSDRNDPNTRVGSMGDITVHALFTRNEYDLTLRVNTPTSGNTSPSQNMVTTVYEGLARAVSASPSAGYVFSHWETISGSVAFDDSLSYSTTVLVSADAEISAHFTPVYTLDFSNDGRGQGIASVASPENVPFTIAPLPMPGYRFSYWEEVAGAVTVSDVHHYYADVTLQDDSELKANYVFKQVYDITTLIENYSFREHGDSTDVGAADGVYFKITGAAHPLQIKVNGVGGAWGKRVIYFGTDATFQNEVNRTPLFDGDTLLVHDTLTAGVTYYFKVTGVVDNQFEIGYQEGGELTLLAEYGLTSPASTMPIFTGTPVNIEVMPSEGFEFTEWIVESGQVSFEGSTSATSAIAIINPITTPVVMRAIFQLPSTAPIIRINDWPDISNHPEICLVADVVDTVNHIYYNGLDTSYFSIWQDQRDGSPIVAPENVITPFTISEGHGVSHTAIAFDQSGSMRPCCNGMDSEITEAMLDYIQGMRINDRTGIVGYGEWTHSFGGINPIGYDPSLAANPLHQIKSPMSSDTTALNQVVSGLTYTGWYNPAIDGMFEGIEMVKAESEPRQLIVITDGLMGYRNVHGYKELIDSVQKYNIQVHAIALMESFLNAPYPDSLRMFTEDLGGALYNNVSLSALSSTLNTIRTAVGGHYRFCYESPDVIFYGDTNDVVLELELLGYNDSDSTWWAELNDAPQIALTDSTIAYTTEAAISRDNRVNEMITISAVITDTGSVDSAVVWYRQMNAIDYVRSVMTPTTNDTFTVDIPADSVRVPGVEFYVIAWDNHRIMGRDSNVAHPELVPHRIVLPNDPPVVSHDVSRCIAGNAATFDVSGNAYDEDGMGNVIMYTLFPGDTLLTRDTTLVNVDSTFLFAIPYASEDSLRYYFEAVDRYGASQRFPDVDTVTLYRCLELTPPIAEIVPYTMPTDSTFIGSTFIKMYTASDADFPGIRIYYVMDPLAVLDTNAQFIEAGEFIEIDTTTHIRMFAYHIDDYDSVSAVSEQTFYSLVKMDNPKVLMLDSFSFLDSTLFADSLHLGFTLVDSSMRDLKIYYSLDGTIPDGTLFWSVDSVFPTLTDTVMLRFYAEAPNWLNSDTLEAVYYPAPYSGEPHLFYEGQDTAGTLFFSDSICFVLDNGDTGATIVYSYSGSFPWSPVTSGDSVCMRQESSFFAYAIQNNYMPSDTVEWVFTKYRRTAAPVISPSEQSFDNVYVEVSIAEGESNSSIWYTLDGSDPTPATGIAYTGPFWVSATTTVKAIADLLLNSQYTSSNVVTNEFTKVHRPTEAIMLDGDGDTLAVYKGSELSVRAPLTNVNNNFTLIGIQADIKNQQMEWDVSLERTGDTRRLIVDATRSSIEEIVYVDQMRELTISEDNQNLDSLLEARVFDLMRVFYQNPILPSDSVVMYIPVQPEPMASTMIVSTVAMAGAADSIVAETTSELFVNIQDQLGSIDSIYSIQVVTQPHIDGVKPDTLIIPLVRRAQSAIDRRDSGDIYFSSFGINTDVRVYSDDSLDVSPGDVIVVSYQDPFDKNDVVSVSVQFGEMSELQGEITLAYTATEMIAVSDLIDGARENVTIVMYDDPLYGVLDTVWVDVLVYDRDSVLYDSEKVALIYSTDSRNWSNVVTLSDTSAAQMSNGMIEWYRDADVIIKAVSHTSSGVDADTLERRHRVVMPDKRAAIIVLDGALGDTTVMRTTDSVRIILEEQSFSRRRDTVSVSLYCLQSGDSEISIQLFENGVDSGVYSQQQMLLKNEKQVVENDGVIQCNITDTLIVEYHDDLYGSVLFDTTTFTDVVVPRITFVNESFDEWSETDYVHLTMLNVRAEYLSYNLDSKDSIEISLVNDQYDSLDLWLVETGLNSHLFEGTVPFGFSAVVPSGSDLMVTSAIDYDALVNQSTVIASLKSDRAVLDTLVVKSAYKKALSAYMHDGDINGFADSVVIHYSGALLYLPSSISALYWSSVVAEQNILVESTMIGFMERDGEIDSAIVIIDLSEIQESIDATGIALMDTPFVAMPHHDYFGGRAILLRDSVSPRLIEVVKTPSKSLKNESIANLKRGPDVFVFRFSEPLTIASTDVLGIWQSQFLVSRNCEERGGPIEFISVRQLDTTRMVWEAAVDKNIPSKKSCITVNNAVSLVFDDHTNVLGRNSTIITGSNRIPPAAIGVLNPIGGDETGPPALWIPPGEDAKVVLPSHLTAVIVTASEKYTGTANIYDSMGSYVRTIDLSFGHQGELEQFERQVENGFMNYIPWDQRDEKGKKVGSGVYIWKIILEYNSGRSEVFQIKTGVLRK